MLSQKKESFPQAFKYFFGFCLLIVGVYFVMPSDAQNNPLGDVNCSETLSEEDGLSILQYSLSLMGAGNECGSLGANEINTTLGDVNNDGTVNGIDALFVYQCEAGIGNALCSELPFISPSVSIIELEGQKTAVEKTATPAEVKLSYNGTVAADQTLTVKFSLSGTTDDTRTSAESDDYTLTVDGQPVTDEVVFNAGENAKTIRITPVNDDKREVPERLHVTIEADDAYTVGSDNSKEIFIADDEPGITEDSLLFVGLMTPEGDAETTASGIATLRLSNDNAYGLIDYSFTGLTTPQTAAHLHYGPISGPVVTGIGLGQVEDYQWDIVASFLSPNDQHMLDTLLAGTLYINAHSTRYPAGEIRGNLVQSQGAIEMLPVEETPEYELLTGDELDRDIARFLNQATFGATQAEFDALKQLVSDNGGDRIAAYDAWIDQQMTVETPSLLEFYKAFSDLYTQGHTTINGRDDARYGVVEGWYTAAIYSKASLRERMGMALSEIFVVSMKDPNIRLRPWAISSYHDMLRTNAFGSYETLLGDISSHPAMGLYLSFFQNKMTTYDDAGLVVTSPDENYAREIMQLFSIGLVELHPDGTLKLDDSGLPQATYSQDDIPELARVFTGWGLAVYNENDSTSPTIIENENFTFGGDRWIEGPYHDAWRTPLKMFETNGREETHNKFQRYHDNEEKRVMGTIFPAGQTGEADMAQAVSMLNDHASTAPFISYRLIQRLVTSNPSRHYIYRVATVFDTSNGDLGEVVKAILLDPEARNLSYTEQATFGKRKEPLIHAVGILRNLPIESNIDAFDSLDVLKSHGLSDAQIALYDSDATLVGFSAAQAIGNDYFNQIPLAPPTVFNWFNPFYTLSGTFAENGLVVPEFEILTNSNVIDQFNYYNALLLTTTGLRGGFSQSKAGTESVKTFVVLEDEPAYLTQPYVAQLDVTDVAAYTDAKRDLAIGAMLESADLLHCNGVLTANATGDPDTDLYQIIFDGLIEGYDHLDNTTAEDANLAMSGRLRTVLYFMGTFPECNVQK